MPNWNIENEYKGLVCGIDEAGRGPWVGPVVAGAVIFINREIEPELLNGIDDSKKLSTQKRRRLYDLLLQEEQKGHICCGIGEASAKEIDEQNILQATFLAMKRAVQKLKIQPSYALIDGNRLPVDFCCPCSCYIKGDSRSYSIAAASILAKVYRDNLLKNMAVKYPQYGFEKNAGYGTKEHIDALKKYGITPEHRKSYRPIRELLNASA